MRRAGMWQKALHQLVRCSLMIAVLRFDERDGTRQHGALTGSDAADQWSDVDGGRCGGAGLHKTSLAEPPIHVIRSRAALPPHRYHQHEIRAWLEQLPRVQKFK